MKTEMNKSKVSRGIAKHVIHGCLAAAVSITLLFAGNPTSRAATADAEIALSLATMLRSARAVISAKQKHINDPKIGDKGLSAEFVVTTAKSNYKKATNSDPDAIDASSVHGKLIQALMNAIGAVMDDAQENINREGVGLKGFLPAVFARLATQKFSTSVDTVAGLKLTAPKKYVRNRANRPDKWEHNVIEKTFKSADHPTNRPVSELIDHKGKPAFRLILPEYYKESCLACHGDPKGERDITGGKKEGGKLGELGGAISVVLYK